MYLQATDEATAELISASLWSLSVPESTNHSTKYYCGWLVHPTTGEAIVDIPNKALYIHPEADTNALDSFLGPLITAEELDQVHSVLNVCRNGGSDPESENYIPGNRLNFLDFLPQSLTGLIRTREELELAGWFPDVI